MIKNHVLKICLDKEKKQTSKLTRTNRHTGHKNYSSDLSESSEQDGLKGYEMPIAAAGMSSDAGLWLYYFNPPIFYQDRIRVQRLFHYHG
jgi:hypothetical protein